MFSARIVCCANSSQSYHEASITSRLVAVLEKNYNLFQDIGREEHSIGYRAGLKDAVYTPCESWPLYLHFYRGTGTASKNQTRQFNVALLMKNKNQVLLRGTIICGLKKCWKF